MTTTLCELPPPPEETCCATPVRPLAAPLPITNAPGLAAIEYRIGTFATFRRAMLERIADADLLHTTDDPTRENPFAEWTEGSPSDYQTMFVELWAYLADVLTFYQERIANEAYIPTATQLDSLMRLAALIGYRPLPGSGSSGLVAFTVEKGKTVTIPSSFKVGSKARGAKPAVVFETSEALIATGRASTIPIAGTVVQNQFAPLHSYVVLEGGTRDQIAAISAAVFGSLGSVILDPLVSAGALRPAAPSSPSSRIGRRGRTPASEAMRTVVFEGTDNNIAAGDWLLVVETVGTVENTIVVRVVSASPDKEEKTTKVVWAEPAARQTAGYDASTAPVRVYAFRVTAAPFGATAPMGLTVDSVTHNVISSGKPWDDPLNAEYNLPASDETGKQSLDGVYDAINVSPSSPGYALFLADNVTEPVPVKITDAKTIGRAHYEISAKVTRLTLAANLTASTFRLRGTTIFAASELLVPAARLPVPEPVTGATLILDGLYPELTAGQTVIFEGDAYDGSGRNAEAAVIAATPVLDAASSLTTIRLKTALTGSYFAAGSVVRANVVAVTQGETVRGEILGSGQGDAFQTFTLKKKPLTWLPSTDPEGLSSVESTLQVTVNSVLWREQQTLAESTPNAREFATTMDSSSDTSVLFGDGVNGARPPAGRDNVRATYRKGIGASGNVAAGGIEQLLGNIAGLQKVVNPSAAAGGSDAETVGEIRDKAPKSIRTFSRAVSIEDYAALALTYPGVAKARAAWVSLDSAGAALARPYVALTIGTTDGVPLARQLTFAAAVRSYLDRRRDPNVPLRIVDFNPVYIDLVATVDILDDHPQQATLAAATAALNPGANADGSYGYFAFARLGFGESLHLSAVYAALQSVPGVRDATITTFREPPADAAGTVRNDILVGPTELAVMANDPADTANAHGKLVLTLGTGGFADR